MAKIGKRIYSNILPWAYEVLLESGVEDPTPIVNLLGDQLGEDLEQTEAWEEAKRILETETPGVSGLYTKAGMPPEDVIEEQIEEFEEHKSEYVRRMKELEEAEAEREKREEVQSKLRGSESRIAELERKLERREELSERKIDDLEEELEFLHQVSNRLLEDVPSEHVKELKDEFMKIEGADLGDFWEWFGENTELIKEKTGVLPEFFRKNYMEPWFEEQGVEEEVKEEAEEVEEVSEGLSSEEVRELTQGIIGGPSEAPEHAPKDPDTGTPLTRLETMLPVEFPPGMVYYVSTDPKSKHYKQVFSLTKKGELGRTTSLKTVLKNLRETKGEFQRALGARPEVVGVEERPVTALERAAKRIPKAVEEHPRFEDFLKEVFDMSVLEYRALTRWEKRAFKEAFKTWVEGL